MNSIAPISWKCSVQHDSGKAFLCPIFTGILKNTYTEYLAHFCSSSLYFNAFQYAPMLENTQRDIKNPVKYLRWSFFAKIVNGENPLNYIRKKV